jgi:hypothetical protein
VAPVELSRAWRRTHPDHLNDIALVWVLDHAALSLTRAVL